MGTPRPRKHQANPPPSRPRTARPSASRPAPLRPESVLRGTDEKTLDLPVRPDTRKPVRPISVRHHAQIGSKAL